MRRSPVLRLDRHTARMAFALGRGGCAREVASANGVLALRRAGCEDVLVEMAALEVDDAGRIVFAWDDWIHCLEPGLYRAQLMSDCVSCGEVMLQLGERCAVVAMDTIDAGPQCEGPDDTCAMSTTCGTPDACGCRPPPVIYVPPYDVPRGC